MGKERDVIFYDTIFKSSEAYSLETSGYDCRYAEVYNKSLANLTKDDIILELGCGTGQLAEMIVKGGFNYLQGIDFSPEALKIAKQRVSADFFLCDLNLYRFYSDYNTIIATEVFEHIINDLEIIARIKKGTKVIFSVPTFNNAAHVRFFETPETVIERYGSLFEDYTVITIDKIFLFVGIKK